jgi:hypothetical protein
MPRLAAIAAICLISLPLNATTLVVYVTPDSIVLAADGLGTLVSPDNKRVIGTISNCKIWEIDKNVYCAAYGQVWNDSLGFDAIKIAYESARDTLGFDAKVWLFHKETYQSVWATHAD